MKKVICLLIGILTPLGAQARTLTSADGSKTISAEIIDYNPTSGKVIIRSEGSTRNTTVNANAFSKEDQEYFNQFLAESAKRKALTITSKNQSEKQEADKTALYIYDKRKETYAMKIANGSPSEVKDLEAKYDIYVSRFDKEGKKILDVVSGKETISSIAGNYAHEFASTPVEITAGCETTSSCPKCKTHAASVETERVIGIHVKLYDKGGDFLSEYYSSGAVKTAVIRHARDAQKNQSGT